MNAPLLVFNVALAAPASSAKVNVCGGWSMSVALAAKATVWPTFTVWLAMGTRVGELFAHVGRIHLDGLLLEIGAGERYFLQQLFHDGVQAARADIFARFVDLRGELRHLFQRIVGENQFDALGLQ